MTPSKRRPDFFPLGRVMFQVISWALWDPPFGPWPCQWSCAGPVREARWITFGGVPSLLYCVAVVITAICLCGEHIGFEVVRHVRHSIELMALSNCHIACMAPVTSNPADGWWIRFPAKGEGVVIFHAPNPSTYRTMGLPYQPTVFGVRPHGNSVSCRIGVFFRAGFLP